MPPLLGPESFGRDSDRMNAHRLFKAGNDKMRASILFCRLHDSNRFLVSRILPLNSLLPATGMIYSDALMFPR